MISYDNGQTYQTIITGLTGNDSSYVWTVPDTARDSCLIAIKAFGPGIGWDESDSVFKISPEGIEEALDTRYSILNVRLEQNYPNPFSASGGRMTNIRYQIADVGQGFPDPLRLSAGSLEKSKPRIKFGAGSEGLPCISLKIYNSVGQLVRTLVDRPQAPGYYEVQWQGIDDNGNALPSGIYFYVLRVDSYSVAKKMILIR